VQSTAKLELSAANAIIVYLAIVISLMLVLPVGSIGLEAGKQTNWGVRLAIVQFSLALREDEITILHV